MKKYSKGFSSITLIVLIVLVVGFYYFSTIKTNTNTNQVNKNIVTNNSVNSADSNAEINKPKTGCLSSTTPWIKILSPNGGEIYSVGQQITVTWTSCNIPSNSLISFRLYFNNSSTILENSLTGPGPGNAVNNGIKNIIIPNITNNPTHGLNIMWSGWSLGGSYFKIKAFVVAPISVNGTIVGTPTSSGIEDLSDNTFTINP